VIITCSYHCAANQSFASTSAHG